MQRLLRRRMLHSTCTELWYMQADEWPVSRNLRPPSGAPGCACRADTLYKLLVAFFVPRLVASYFLLRQPTMPVTCPLIK